ncbi:uncharacterized protein si:ch211-195m9.3 [Conger conger]|uniref:uncharacterized protein si:ch211-195m9.3 n=1 Tax=Conger conger TaxID=82655 RepID=UPI002A599BE2|nr:uncharacterized protein si:ch211-195m9.3 [Conger conger]
MEILALDHKNCRSDEHQNRTARTQEPSRVNKQVSDKISTRRPACHNAWKQPCGFDCTYDPQVELCCINQTSHSGRAYGLNYTCCEGHLTHTPGVFQGRCCGFVGYDPRIQNCCGGTVTRKDDPNQNQCCGEKSYSVMDQKELCCDGVLHPLGSNMMEVMCIGSRIHHRALDTQCNSILHPQPGLHCCGHQTYYPARDLCCAGHRWPEKWGMDCCGVQYYDHNDPKKKCCSGHLHSSAPGSRCCGALLITDETLQECCASTHEQLMYRRRDGFSCCGHLYYNTSQHSCCAGRLHTAPGIRPQENPGHCELITFDNLNTCDLKNVLTGSVESMAVENGSREVVVKSVLWIHEGNMEAKTGTHLLRLDHCSCPPLTKDRFYLFIGNGTDRMIISDLVTPVFQVHDLLSRCPAKADFGRLTWRVEAEGNMEAETGTHLLRLDHCSCPPLTKDRFYLFIGNGTGSGQSSQGDEVCHFAE